MATGLPVELQEAIDALLSKTRLGKLALSSERLSERYREKGDRATHFFGDEGDYLAYVATRLPATYAVISSVFEEVKRRLPELSIQSLLDVGAGPGTGLWAAQEAFEHLKEATLIEREKGLIHVGKTLAEKCLVPATWIEADCKQLQNLPRQDLVLLSYVINELDPGCWDSLLKKLWESADKLLVVIEPGTPEGFDRILRVRERVIQLGGSIVAPCPHQKRCPAEWCHFSERLERSGAHRFAKRATLGYEDEKFSYIVASKHPAPISAARVVRHPQYRPGHVELTLCTDPSIKNITISKKQKEKYRIARKIKWGDLYTE